LLRKVRKIYKTIGAAAVPGSARRISGAPDTVILVPGKMPDEQHDGLDMLGNQPFRMVPFLVGLLFTDTRLMPMALSLSPSSLSANTLLTFLAAVFAVR
jgi:hypothetical protein